MPEDINLETSCNDNVSDSEVVEAESQSAPSHPTSRHKTQKDLEKDEILRKLQSLVSGDRLYFKKSTLGQRVSSIDTPTSSDFVESKFVCWLHDKMSIYLVVHINPFGRLRFKYGDLYRMALSHDLFFHKLDSRYIKLLKSDHFPGYKKPEYSRSRQDTSELEEYIQVTASSRNDIEALKQKLANSDFKNRPMPPGVDAFCKCKFTNKNEFVKKLRAIIKSNRHKFMEKTINMKELRLIMSQNVRAYELEMLGYIMDENPWAYSSNPSEKPSQEQIKDIVEQYRNSVKNPLYIELYNKWLRYLKTQNSQNNSQ